MYSRDDIKEMFSDLKNKIDYKVEDEVNYYLNMSGIIVFSSRYSFNKILINHLINYIAYIVIIIIF